jgi:hypothetical protein
MDDEESIQDGQPGPESSSPIGIQENILEYIIRNADVECQIGWALQVNGETKDAVVGLAFRQSSGNLHMTRLRGELVNLLVGDRMGA